MDTESKAFRLLDLPTELVNDILGHVPLHHDLLNFALASRFCSSLAIPQHTEYRVIYFHDDHIDEIWTHLAQRPNLAFNIRDIHVMNEEAEDEDDLCLGPSWHWPRTFFQSTHDVFPKSTEELHEDMFTALTCMRRLERVHWNWASKESEHLIPKVLEILKGITTLKHLSFNQLKEFTTDLPLEKHPLWAMSAFESLSLDGSAWYSLPRADIGKRSLVTWFHSLSSLQSLRMDVEPFLRCSQKLSLPNLRYLGLQGDTVLHIQMMDFLERHPGIEGLAMSLRRLYTCIVPKDFLPNLKQLACLPAFLLDLQALSTTWDITGCPSWHLEYLNIESGWWNRDEYEEQDFIKGFCDFTYLDRTSLPILSLDVSGSVESLRKLAETFPRIEELQLSTALYHRGRQTTRMCKFSDMILIFPHFHNLRVIHGHSIWMDHSTRVWTDFSHLSPEEHHKKYNVSPIDPVTNFALNACTNPRRILIGKLYTQTDEWTYNTEVNHRVLALARRCRKLERVDSNMTDDDIIWIRRKKLDWGKIKVMADWLGVGKNKTDTEWEEVDYTVRERCSKNPFETMPKRINLAFPHMTKACLRRLLRRGEVRVRSATCNCSSLLPVMSTTYNDYDHILQSPGHLSTESTTSLRTQIDLEIRELHHRLQYLATVRNTLAPVARLPREVLGKIFDLVRVDDNGRVLVKRILPASWVSQHWRDVVLGDPKLWNQIDRSNCHWAIWCLIRSKTTPLFIQLSDDAIEILPAATIDTLLRELPRIQLLRLGGEDLELDGRARNRSKYSSIDHIILEAPDFKSILTGTSTLLKTLHLGTYVTGDTFANLAMPNLAHLKLQSCTFKWNEFLLPSLKTLCVQRPSTTIPTIDILKLLSRMPLLEEITLNDALSEERLSGSHLEPLRFPHLRLLTLSDYFTNQLSDLANNMVIPQNASLSIAGSISSGVRVEEVLQSFFPVVQRRINAMSLSPDTAAISRHSMMDTFCVGFGRCDTNGVIGNTVVQSQSAGSTFDTPLQIFRNLPGPVGDIRCLQIRGFWFLKDGDFDDFVRLVEMMPNVEELVLEEFVAMSLLLHLGNFPNTSLPPRLKKITHGKIYSTLNNIQLTDAQIEGLILWRKNSSTKMVLKDPDLKSDPFNSKRQEAVFDEVDYEEGTQFLFSADEY